MKFFILLITSYEYNDLSRILLIEYLNIDIIELGKNDGDVNRCFPFFFFFFSNFIRSNFIFQEKKNDSKVL